MKYLNKILLTLSLFALVVSGCEETEFEKTEDNVGRYVAFTQTSASIDENNVVTSSNGVTSFTNNTYEVEVFRSTSDLSQPLNVNVNLDATFLADSEFANAGDDASSNITLSQEISTLTIPAGEVSTSFYISTVNNTIATGDIEVSMDITSVSDAAFKIGLQSTREGQSLTLVIVDDDCPFISENLTGTFSVEQYDLHGGPSLEGTYEVTITQDPGNPLVLIIDGLVANLYGTVDNAQLSLSLVTCKKEALFPSGEAFAVYNPTGGPVALTRRDAFFGGEPGPVFSEQNGILFEENSDWVTYDDEAGTINIYGWLEVLGLGSFGGKQFILTKVE